MKGARRIANSINRDLIEQRGKFSSQMYSGRAESQAKDAESELRLFDRHRRVRCPDCFLHGVKFFFGRTRKAKAYFRDHLRIHVAVREQLGPEMEAAWIISAYDAFLQRRDAALKKLDYVASSQKRLRTIASRKSLDALLQKFGMDGVGKAYD